MHSYVAGFKCNALVFMWSSNNALCRGYKSSRRYFRVDLGVILTLTLTAYVWYTLAILTLCHCIWFVTRSCVTDSLGVFLHVNSQLLNRCRPQFIPIYWWHQNCVHQSCLCGWEDQTKVGRFKMSGSQFCVRFNRFALHNEVYWDTTCRSRVSAAALQAIRFIQQPCL